VYPLRALLLLLVDPLVSKNIVQFLLEVVGNLLSFSRFKKNLSLRKQTEAKLTTCLDRLLELQFRICCFDRYLLNKILKPQISTDTSGNTRIHLQFIKYLKDDVKFN
jgi:hypothetical protein